VKYIPHVIVTFLLFCCFIDFAFGNPIPWDPWEYFWNLELIQYFSIIISQFCGLVVGTAILKSKHQDRWLKGALTMLIALMASYILGIVTWTLAYRAGILTYDYSNPITILVLLLPEVIGTILGAVIIHIIRKTHWKTALIAMVAAMVTSFLVNLLLGSITYLI